MSVSFFSRLKYRLLSLAITVFLLSIAFGINFSLTSLSNSLEKESKNSKDEFVQNVNRFIALLRSVVVSSMNVVLKKIMLKLALLEKDNTLTKYNLSVTLKYLVVTAINTVLIPVVTNLDKNTWFTAGGLVVEVFFNLIILWIFTPIFYIFNFSIIIKKIKIFLEKRKGNKSKLTQRELNKLYEGPSPDLAKGYSEILLILAITVFYSPLLPSLPVIAFFGIILHFWIKKYVLLRMNKIPETMGEDLALGLNTVLPIMTILYGLGQYYFIRELSDNNNYFILPILIFTILFYLVPKDCLTAYWEGEISRDDDETYQKNKYK